MNKILLHTTCVILLLATTSAQLVAKGTCPNNIKVVSNFSVENYMGKWYEYAKYPAKSEASGNCNTAQYSLNQNGRIAVKNSLVNKTTNKYYEIGGTALQVTSGKLMVVFPISFGLNVSIDYWVLDTDYENYSVVYSCHPLNNNSHALSAWILTRQALPAPKNIEKAANVLENNNMSLSDLEITNQLSCKPSYPNNIQVVGNFSVKDYMGTWYEYAKYPVQFEHQGKCITAQYSLSNRGLIYMKNTLVDEFTNLYSTIWGNATLVANGKLLVKFPVSPAVTVASNYWILDTDYRNYSVVYSYNPLNGKVPSVHIWILTREAIPQPNSIKMAVKALKRNNISLNELRITNQISCNE